jgi:uncharacterized membrane protein YkoI
MTATLVAALVGTVAMGARATAAQQMAMRAATGRSAADTAVHTTAHAVQIRGKKSLKAQAKISGDSAMAVARARVPGATVTSGKIDRENKRLVYKINLEQPGAKGVEHVWVDATTGDVVKTKHSGGVAGKVQHAQESHRLKSAQKDSTKRTP